MRRLTRALVAAALAGALAATGCGKGDKGGQAAGEGDCARACAHVLELAHADLEKSLAELPDSMKESMADLRAQAEASRDSDLATCTQQCRDGKLDARCALRATDLDAAMRCTSRRGAR